MSGVGQLWLRRAKFLLARIKKQPQLSLFKKDFQKFKKKIAKKKRFQKIKKKIGKTFSKTFFVDFAAPMQPRF